MKKIITVCLVALSFVACNDDDNAIDPIVGKWYAHSVIVKGNTINYEGNTSCGKDYLQLNNFNTYEIGDYQEVDGTPCEVTKYFGSYSVTDNSLKLYGSSFFQGGTIVEKSENTLKLRRMVDVDGDGTSDEVIEVFTR